MNHRILVTAIGGNGVGSQIVSALFLAFGDNMYLVGTDVKRNCVVGDKINSFYVVPLSTDILYYSVIRNIVIDENIEVIIPGSMSEMSFFLQYQKDFESLGIKICCNNSEAFNLCRSKSRLSEILINHRIEIPKYKLIKSVEDCYAVDFFPVIIKQNIDGMKSNNVVLAFDQEELIMLSQLLIKRGINELIAQEWITDGEEYSISVVSNELSEVLGCCSVKRCFDTGLSVKETISHNGRKYNISSGITEGILIINPEIVQQVRKIAYAIGSTSMLNIQGIWKNGILFVIDAHALITSGVLVRALGGYNEPAYMVLRLLGQKTPLLEYKECNVRRRLESVII